MNESKRNHTLVPRWNVGIVGRTRNRRVRFKMGGCPGNLLDKEGLKDRTSGVGPGKVTEAKKEERPKFGFFDETFTDMRLEFEFVLGIIKE